MERSSFPSLTTGNSTTLETLRKYLIYPITYAEEAEALGLRPLKWPKGFLLCGPDGAGQASLVRAVVQECSALHLISISPSSVRIASPGDTFLALKALRDAFDKASSRASEGKPSVIFIDDLDVICPHRDISKMHEYRMVSQLHILMDSINSSSSIARIAVVGSTHRVHLIDPTLRRSGRFGTEIEVTALSEQEHLHFLKLCTKKVVLDESVDLLTIASSCNGFVVAEIQALCREAAVSALWRCSKSGQPDDMCVLTSSDWSHARSIVSPRITRGITKEVPKVTWDDIGGVSYLKKKLQQTVQWPIKHREAFARLGATPRRGVLLHGPPGCSKTTLVRAAANASNAAFFSLSGAEVYSMYVGEGEALLRKIFQTARLAAPSIIFFDEADAIAARRGGQDETSVGNAAVGERLLSTLLTEMDGLEPATGVLVLAATNRPKAIDPALMRPGRFDLILYVPPPDLESRIEILQVKSRQMKLDNDVDFGQIAAETELFTGAELDVLCQEAGMAAFREDSNAIKVSGRHFKIARSTIKPQLSKEVISKYESFGKRR